MRHSLHSYWNIHPKLHISCIYTKARGIYRLQPDHKHKQPFCWLAVVCWLRLLTLFCVWLDSRGKRFWWIFVYLLWGQYVNWRGTSVRSTVPGIPGVKSIKNRWKALAQIIIFFFFAIFFSAILVSFLGYILHLPATKLPVHMRSALVMQMSISFWPQAARQLTGVSLRLCKEPGTCYCRGSSERKKPLLPTVTVGDKLFA